MARIPDVLTQPSFRIVGTYLLFGILWIVVTDTAVAYVAETQAQATRFQTIKGWVFVLLSSALILALISSWENQLDDVREVTDLALDSLDDFYLVLSPNRELTRVNERAAEVIGISKSELVGDDPLTLIAAEDRTAASRAITNAYESGHSRVELRVTTSDGRYIQYEFRGRQMVDGDGTLRGVAIIGRDITDRILNEQRLHVSLRVLRHNLRNKLNVIRGWAETMQESDDHASAAEQIVETTDYLIDMSEKARQMAKLREGIGESSADVWLVTHVRTTLEDFQARHPSVRVESDLPDRPGPAVSYGSRLETALQNVLENAVEHNASADPWVRVVMERSQDGTRIEVHDNGPGIPAVEQNVLEGGFETPLAHSSGVGLWLVNWCVTTIGGSVHFEDRHPTGSVVILTFPLTDTV